jgi:hypothetical protein
MDLGLRTVVVRCHSSPRMSKHRRSDYLLVTHSAPQGAQESVTTSPWASNWELPVPDKSEHKLTFRFLAPFAQDAPSRLAATP